MPYSRAHLAKHTGGQWFTAARAHKYDNHASDRCRCCDEGKIESTAHIFQCPTRDSVHQQYTTKFTELMKDKELTNDILRMFETGIDLVLTPPPRPCYHDDLTAAAAMFEDERVLKILNDTTINEARRLAFEQQTKIGWSRLFLGLMMIEWSRSTANLEHQWTSSCLRLFLDWGRACWTHRNYLLFGPASARRQQRRKRLQAEARVWITAPHTESLVPLNSNGRLKRDITRATTETIATWVHRQALIRKRIRKKKKTNIITQILSEEELQEADRVFHNKLLEARRGIRPRTEITKTNEEPPD